MKNAAAATTTTVAPIATSAPPEGSMPVPNRGDAICTVYSLRRLRARESVRAGVRLALDMPVRRGANVSSLHWGAAQRAAGSPGGNDFQDFDAERCHLCRTSRARQARRFLVRVFNVVGGKNEFAALRVVTESHASDLEVDRRTGRKTGRERQQRGLARSSGAGETSDVLVDHQTERLQLLLLEPEGGRFRTALGEQSKGALTRLAD